MTIDNMSLDNIHSSSCKETGYSLDYQSKEPDFAHDSANEYEITEPFNNEKEALDFATHYSKMVINEER